MKVHKEVEYIVLYSQQNYSLSTEILEAEDVKVAFIQWNALKPPVEWQQTFFPFLGRDKGNNVNDNIHKIVMKIPLEALLHFVHYGAQRVNPVMA